MSQIKLLSFAKGEISPSLHARSDTAAYATGLKTCRNQLVMKQGGLRNRPGTKYIAETKYSSVTSGFGADTGVRLIPFIFNDDQAYILEFGNLYMRVISNGTRVEVSSFPAWNSGTAYAAGALVSYSGRNYYATAANTNSAPPFNGNETWYLLTDSIFEIPTPYATADLMELNFAQSADVMTIVHRNYAPRDLARTALTGWTLTEMTFGSQLAPPIGLNGARGTFSSGFNLRYVVTSLNRQGEESVRSADFTLTDAGVPTTSAPHALYWAAVENATSYNVYKYDHFGAFGLVGNTTSASFQDSGVELDTGKLPPQWPNPFNPSPFYIETSTPGVYTLSYPSAVTYSQQSLVFGGSPLAPSRIWKSRAGSRKNFDVGEIADDSPVHFDLQGKTVTEVRHLTELTRLLAFTSRIEFAINGDESGTIRPTTINSRAQGYNGVSRVRPLEADALLFVPARGTSVRAFDFSLERDRFSAPDLTVYSAHLFKARTIVDWDFQRSPDSIVWVALDNGELLGLTFVQEQEMLAWHRHDTDGTVENVCVVPEGREDAVYLVVKRTIQGVTKRYIERLHSREFDEIEDGVFVDCSISYDGRHGTDTKLTLSSQYDWIAGSLMVMTASAATFSEDDAVNIFKLHRSDGAAIVVAKSSFVDSTHMNVSLIGSGAVPESLRDAPATSWTRARSSMAANHLTGKEVSIIADGIVIASPMNTVDDYETVTVSGAIEFGGYYGVVHVGLPYSSDVETLTIDRGARKSLITSVELAVEDTRRTFVGVNLPEGDALTGLVPIFDKNGGNSTTAPDLFTGEKVVQVKGDWQANGRVAIRHVDPSPQSILAISPVGLIGGQP